jgi:hypothetical protein
VTGVRRPERLVLLLALAVTLGWLTVEEKSRLGAMVIALPWAALIALRLPLRRVRRTAETMIRAVGAGGLIGPLAALLMLVKIGLHSHAPPDYGLADVLAMIAWAPVGIGLGAVLGLGLAMIRQAWPGSEGKSVT